MNSDVVSKLILDEIEDIVYISDPVSHELYYINGQLQRDLGNISEEQWRRKKCYEILQGKTEPCDFCTNHLLCHEKFHSWEHYNQIIDDHFLIQDKLVNF